jgi:hypothetical protein
MTPTRRTVLIGGSAALVAPFLHRNAYADGTVLCWHDRPLDQYTTLHEAASSDGYRLLSLSIYGPATAPLYTAVMIKRTQAAEQHHWPLLNSAQLTQTLSDQGAQNFGAIILAATGPASDPRFALVCERQETVSLALFGLKSGRADEPATLQGKHRDARIQGFMPRWIASYGSAEEPSFAGVWGFKTGPTTWNGDGVAETAEELLARLNAQSSGWCRPALLALSQDGRHASVFVDNQVGTWQARYGLTSAQYEQELESWTAKNYVPV